MYHMFALGQHGYHNSANRNSIDIIVDCSYIKGQNHSYNGLTQELFAGGEILSI